MAEKFSNVAFHEHLGKKINKKKSNNVKRGKKIKSPLRMRIFGMKGTLLAEQNRENSVGKWSLPANLKIAYASACPSFNGYSPLFCLNQGELWNLCWD